MEKVQFKRNRRYFCSKSKILDLYLYFMLEFKYINDNSKIMVFLNTLSQF